MNEKKKYKSIMDPERVYGHAKIGLSFVITYL